MWRDVLLDPPPDGERCLVRWTQDGELRIVPFNPCIARAIYQTGLGLTWSYEPSFVSQDPNEWMELCHAEKYPCSPLRQ
jgi:hypothetical protein